MRQLGFSLKTRASLVAALITCAVAALAAPQAQADTIETVAGNGSYGFSGDGGPATAASFRDPGGIATTADGGYLVADSSNGRVRKVSANGSISTVAGGGSLIGAAANDQPATSARLNGVWGIEELSDGSFLFVEDARVRKVSPAGILTTVAGNGGYGYGGDGGPATAATLWSPTAIAVLPGGGFLIADNDNNRIRKVDAAGNISTVAGTGAGWPPGGDGGLATNARIVGPRGLAALPGGGFLIAGEDNRIRKVDAFGIISTVAGGGSDSTANGVPATSASLNGPSGIEAEADGSFVFADQWGYRLRRVRNGVIRTVAGTGALGFSGDNGEAASAQIAPFDVVSVPGGYLVTDINNNRVRKITLSDADNDGVYDRDDNCREDSNADQADLDRDGTGDVCDSDRDGDSVANGTDLFPDDPAESADGDGDGTGDNADTFDNDPTETTDTDLDGKGDNSDNCPVDANADQANLDGDSRGDLCDADIDGDGAPNHDDAFPRDANETADSDGDGVGDNADKFPGDPDEWSDGDTDGVGDNGDNCPTDPNASQADLDSDGDGDACDADIDGDGAVNGADAFPRDAAETADTDGDGTGDNADAFDNDPNETEDSDGDGVGNNADAFDNDPEETTDTDSDGVGDNGDNCLANANPDQANLDHPGDGLGDVCDPDIDGDGVDNGDDVFPRDSTETADADRDGTGDAADAFDDDPTETTDTDSDGKGDNGDNCRTDANEGQADLDNDGRGDACDPDIDGDNVANGDDTFPFDPAESSDRDGDGIGDNADRFPDDASESADTDDDGVGDGGDNCREQPNAGQADQDGDGIGDPCDGDVDGDSVANEADNCGTTANEDQADRDEDGTGDACDDTPRPTPASICRLLTDYVVSSPKYAALSSNKQAAVRESLGNICNSIEKITARLNPQQKAVLVRLQRLSVRAFARDWLTAAQADKLDRLIGNM